jgi:hypothetical protein
VVTITRGRLSALFVAAIAVASGVFFVLGARLGSNNAVAELRSVAFGSRESDLRRLLELDSILASGDLALARVKVGALAWAQYSALEDDASGTVLPPTEAMRDSIRGVRIVVDKFCQSDEAAFHADSKINICADAVRRSNKSLERAREG